MPTDYSLRLEQAWAWIPACRIFVEAQDFGSPIQPWRRPASTLIRLPVRGRFGAIRSKLGDSMGTGLLFIEELNHMQDFSF